MPSLLDALRQRSVVDCDTLDSEVAKSLGPFVDCTSNQAIAYFELTKLAASGIGLHHESLIRESIDQSMGNLGEIRGQVALKEFVVEVMMVKLQLLIAPHVTGYLHVQTNPKLSYSQTGTVNNAKRIIAIFQALAPNFDIKRICIKIPATWEGLSACRALEAEGIATLATTMFCMEQAALASDANCTYIAPYINELKVHFDKGYIDLHKAFSFCREAQAYYDANNQRTRVLAASLTSVEEVLQLAGVHHVTISPILLTVPLEHQYDMHTSGDIKWASTVTESEAQERIDLGVSPNDEKWNDTYRMFEDLFADEDTPIGEILASKFTQHEIRLFMLYTSKVLKAIQDDNTARFNALLQTRLQDAAPEIITKLTMLYFGLPIEPIDFSLTDMTYKMEIREPDSPQSVGDRPLQFLTAHKQRNWGDESLIEKEDQSHPLPTQLPQKLLSSLFADFFSYAPLQKSMIEQESDNTMLRLRGGELDEDNDWEHPGDNNDWEEDDGADSYAASSSEDGSEDVDAKEGKAKKSQSRQTSKGSNKVGGDTASDNEAGDDEKSDAECNEDSAHVLPDSKRDNFITLYGYQGSVTFVPGNQPTYEEAIRRLLSLGPQDTTTFYILHFAKNCSLVDDISDTFPFNSSSASLEYISKQDLTLQPSFFIKLGDDDVPDHWEPSEAQLACEVSRVIWNHHEDKALEPASESTGPVSSCYLEFPTPDYFPTSRGKVNSWNFDQYSAYVRAAFEVLLGPPLGPFHHALFHMHHPSIDYSTSPEYGFPAIKNSDMNKLSDFFGEDTLELRCTRLDDKNEVVFALPSYYNNDFRLGRISCSEDETIEALKTIRQIMSGAFGEETQRLRHVRLLHGGDTFGPETDRNQKSYSIQLNNDGPEDSETSNASVLSEFFADGGAFALLYPEWEEDATSLSIVEPNGHGEAEPCVQMPPLSSTVEEFRNRVFELMQLTGYAPSHAMRVRSGKSFISIQPLPEDGCILAEENAPCFFIGSNTTDEEWFKIRARIATPKATVRIMYSGKWDWNWGAGGQKPSLWGPRYGRMAEAQATKQQKKVSWAEEAELIPDSVTTGSLDSDRTRASVENDGPVAVSHLDWAQLQSRKMKAASDSEKRQKTYATQPSIFDRYRLVPWPANSGIRIPTNAPPFEHMLRTGPRMPLVSKAILTPTEQGELQRVTWDLRNLCLNRAVRCPYDGCSYSYTLNDETAMRKHLKACHTARKCMWCDETIYEHWDTTRINRHIREKHRDELMEALGVSQAAIRRFDKEGTISVPLRRVQKYLGRSALDLASEHAVCETHNSPEAQSDKARGFCDRCGRSRTYYTNIEQVYHRAHCLPGIFNGANCTFCTVCGKSVWLSAADAHKSGKSDGQLTHCSHNVDDTNGPHCSRCGFNMSRLPQNGRDQHQKRCRGFGALSGRFCLYCGEEFRNTETQVDWNRNKDHMVACYRGNPKAISMLEDPEEAAFEQQQNNLRLQINIAALASEEEQGQNGKSGDLDGDKDGQPSQKEPVTGSQATTHDQEMADSSAEDVSTALGETIQETAASQDVSQLPIPGSDTDRHSQETLRTILRQSISDTPDGEQSPRLSTEAPDNALQRKSLSIIPTRQPSPVQPAEENEKEPEFETGAESPLFVSSSSSEAGSDAGSVFGKDQDVYHSADGESEDELLSDPSKSKRRKPRGRKRTREGDRNYLAESDDDDSEIDEEEGSADPSKSKRQKPRGRKRTREDDRNCQAASDDDDDDDDDDDSEIDEEGRRSRLPQRLPSPDWSKILPNDPDFVPSEEYYCSKCFRKAPKNHKRDRSPLGRKNEIELHHDPGRCCGIRRGIGSIERLPNRSGWIPASLMPKPLSTLRKKFLRRYPVYARTIYPLNATNANGTYWRSDPNNESNSAWWNIPWPAFRGPAPLPNGWEAPDVIAVPAAGRARQQFQLKPLLDPTYRQGGDVQYSDEEDVDDFEPGKDDNGKRKRKRKATTAKKLQKTAVQAEPVNVEKAAAPRPVKKRALDPTYRQDHDVQYSDDENMDDVEPGKDANGKRKRKRKATTAPDPTYRQGNNVQYSDDEDVDGVESDKDANGKRKRKTKATTAKKMQKTTTNVEAAVPRPVRKRTPKKAKSQAALSNTDELQSQEGEVVTRRSTRKRQKTTKE
ncbi:hypothetical protein MKX08_008722 [Trichoderma sp. CBMAI-0020]|nr:hypothetical protein MKX08_008722 [Trichoderma sp. CBMAI-0020]WOD45943.1 hypothetical protein [Trichoderma atroviride]